MSSSCSCSCSPSSSSWARENTRGNDERSQNETRLNQIELRLTNKYDEESINEDASNSLSQIGTSLREISERFRANREGRGITRNFDSMEGSNHVQGLINKNKNENNSKEEFNIISQADKFDTSTSGCSFLASILFQLLGLSVLLHNLSHLG